MIEAIIFVIIGTFIGWNLPQPEWAKDIQSKVLNYIKRK